ncbi:phospholipase A2 inhibitor gamma subunit B-like [Zootoca vivipara]|uniref:phospholipase A2 inhibitor gamma subunit B-like n=1 Tax=Zootoca vivipara TaxID=8524 RepID=UPI00293B988F|nr:phospholipase A2 inhibitor gamma subunit B-like [Zootoca vivipara]XP_060131629.1 phospholipase A2 inhibitor gamma subunit B-like [Zootoca vivipara]
MWSLLGCFLLTAFLATGTCLQCEVCYGTGSNCTGEMKTCGAGQDTCIISLMEYLQTPVTITYVAKDCGSSSFCKIGAEEINLGSGVRVRSNRVCYKEDQCGTVSLPVLPPPDTKPNGLQCSGCVGLFSTKCNEKPVACSGEETKCVNITGNITAVQTIDISFKGCANEAFCTILNSSSRMFAGISVDLTKTECNAAVSIKAL